MRRLLESVHVRAVAGYGVLAAAFSWPLPLHLRTHLLGSTGGDTGVYLWNLWVFRHELVDNHHLPFFTSTIFSLDAQTDLSLHNYTVFADLLAVPLLPILGVVGTFNLLYLLMVAVNGYAMFLLARELGAGKWEAWLAGALFAFAPCLVARSTAHFSLVMAAPIVVFVWLLHRADRRPRRRTGLAAGVVIAWATLCDPYYGVYCLMLGAWHLAWRAATVRCARREGAPPRSARLLGAAIGLVLALVAWIAVTGGGSARVLGRPLEVRTLYTPVLVLTALVLVRLAILLRPRLSVRRFPGAPRLVGLAPYGLASGAAVLSPLLYVLGTRVARGDFVSAPVFWRTSMPGIDLLALLLPNPNHPLFRALSEGWLTRQPGGYAENVASIPLVALLLVLVAVRWAGFRPPRYFLALGLGSAALAAGPFFRFAGVLTYVPTPWALLRSSSAPARRRDSWPSSS